MASEKRYRIERESPVPVRMSDFGVARDDEGADVMFHTCFTGEVSVDEYRAMFGEAADIVRDMCIVVLTPMDRLPVHVTANDVLACDSWNTSHHFIINAYREEAGLPRLGDEVIEDAGLAYGEISPDAVLFLMEMYDGVPSAVSANPAEQLAKARERGLALSDFVREPYTVR